MEMREIIEKILEMREMRENLKNAGDILEVGVSRAMGESLQLCIVCFLIL